jgi:F-type H+-transporting ATPase subunit b
MYRPGSHARSLILAAAVLLAAGSPCCAQGGQTYPGDLGQAIATLVIFLVLLVVLGKWAWGPIVKQLRRREEDLAKTLEEARQRQEKADALQQEYQQLIDNIDAEAQRQLAEARKQADTQREQIIQAARHEARESVERARLDIDRARAEALTTLRAETGEMAADIVRQFLRRNLSEQEHRLLLDEAADQVAAHAGQEASDAS